MQDPFSKTQTTISGSKLHFDLNSKPQQGTEVSRLVQCSYTGVRKLILYIFAHLGWDLCKTTQYTSCAVHKLSINPPLLTRNVRKQYREAITATTATQALLEISVANRRNWIDLSATNLCWISSLA